MYKKLITLFFSVLLLSILFSIPSFAGGIRVYGEGNDNFHRDHFYISKDENGHGNQSDTSGGIGGIDSNGYYNGWVDPQDESTNFKVWYKMDFTGKDKQRINKGDISVKVKMWVADTRTGLNDYAIFELFTWVTDSWKSLAYKKEALENSATWTFTKDIPINSTALELDFSSDESGDNDVEFKNIDVYFYDKNAPTVTKIETTDTGFKKIGSTVTFKVVFDEAVKVNGTSKIKMNSGANAYAYYTSGTGTDTLTFSYTVAAGDEAETLNTSGNLEYGGTGDSISDDAGNNTVTTLLGKPNNLTAKNIKIDGKKPEISSISAVGKDTRGKTDKQLNSGDWVTMTVNFSEAVNVTGTASSIKLPLNNGGYAICQGAGTGAVTSLSFKYTVASTGQDIAALNINGDLIGGTIKDSGGNDLVRTTKSISTAGIRVDNTPAAAQFTPDKATTYKRSQSTSVTISDVNGSGLTGMLYKYIWSNNADTGTVNWNNAADASAGTTQALAKSGVTGQYYLHIRTEDIAGNYGYYKGGSYYLDNQNPTISLDKNGSSSPQNDYSVKVTVQDALVSIDSTSLRFQWYRDVVGTNWRSFSLTSGMATITAIGKGVNDHIDSHGNWRLAIEASDSLGNKAVYTSNTFLIDKMPPEITINPSPNDTDDYKKSHSVSISYSDLNGGFTPGGIAINGKKYQWTDSTSTPTQNWLDYDGYIMQQSFTGVKYLHVKIQDTAGNVATKHQLFLYDNTNPTITFNNNGSETVQGSVAANITPADAHAGIKELFYQWTPDGNYNEGSWKYASSYNIPLTDVNGDWYLSILAIDNAGNKTTATSNRFRMDNMPPEGGINIVEEYTNSNIVDIDLWASDTNYPDQIQYRISLTGDDVFGGWKTFVPRLDNVEVSDTEGVRMVKVQYRDKFLNESAIHKDTVIIDKTPPTADILYSENSWTKENVLVTLGNIQDTYQDGEVVVARNSKEVTLVNSNETISYDAENHTYGYTFQNNGSRSFTLRDRAGNEAVFTAEVTWIDKTNPEISFSLNGNNNPSKNANVTVTATDTVKLGDNILKDEDIKTIYYQWNKEATSPVANDLNWLEVSNRSEILLDGVDGNWYLHIKAVDCVGNTTINKTNRFLMDNTPPTASISYSNEDRTANPVTSYISFNEYAIITNPMDGGNYRTFDENGEFTFMYKDVAGNTGETKVIVDWIDKSLPSAKVNYSTRNWTNENVTVTFAVYEGANTELINFNIPIEMDYKFVSSKVNENLTVVEAVYEIGSNGSFDFTVRDLDTDISDRVKVVINNIDKVLPAGEIIYSEINKTQNDIEVYIISNDNSNQKVEVIAPEEADIQEVNGNLFYVFYENGDYDFTLRDAAGNEKVLTASISNIDREAPNAALEYSKTAWTNQNVIAIITPEEEVEILNTDVAQLDNDGITQYLHTFFENGDFIFRIQDSAGNIREIEAVVSWIDKTSPDGEMQYSTVDRTNKNVIVTIQATDNSGELVQVVHPDNVIKLESDEAAQYEIEENGIYEFILVDPAGNTKALTATVNNIDKNLPTADINYSNTAITNKNVEIRLTLSEEATVTHPEGLLVKESGGNIIYEASKNGEYAFIITDIAGNVNTFTASIGNIDKTPPVGYVTYSTKTLTNKNVNVTVFADEEFAVSNNFNQIERVFYENGSYTFIITDLAGNISQVKAEVNNIDKTPPKVSIKYSTKELTNKNVVAVVVSDEEFIVLNNGGKTTFEFTQNGSFLFEIADPICNSTTVYANVNNIDKTPPVIALDVADPLVFAVAPSGSSKAYEDELRENIKRELQKYTAFDSTDGDLISKVTYDINVIDLLKPGTYEIIYSVSDKAGNTGVASRSVTMVDRKTFKTFVNGFDPTTEQMIFNTSKLKFNVMNPKGNLVIKWKEGYWSEGSMKSMANLVEAAGEEYIFEANKAGFYTFLIQDQERNTAFLQVFVQNVDTEGVK